MSEKNMTALVSCFARAYHYRNNEMRVFADDYAEKLMTQQEYDAVAGNMSGGISYFNPDFKGNAEEALRWIVDNQLSPSVLGRSAFCEKKLADAVKEGCGQYLIFAAGYDTFAYRNDYDSLKVFELDLPDMIDDKVSRTGDAGNRVIYIPCDLSSPSWQDKLMQSAYDAAEISFCSLLGISYYLTGAQFEALLRGIASAVCPGSMICFDYPYPSCDAGEESARNEEMAAAAGEQMKAKYSRSEVEMLLNRVGFEVMEHLDDDGMTENYFDEYNEAVPEHQMKAPAGVGYCLAVLKRQTENA